MEVCQGKGLYIKMIEIKDKRDCCGCRACSESCPKKCITMIPDEEGFHYPQVELSSCIDCQLCEKVCPIVNVNPDVPFKQRAYLVQNQDKKVLEESTSGGAFTAIAEVVLNEGGVVFGAAFDEALVVMHRSVQCNRDLHIFRNSKYVQSDTCHTFSETRDYLNQGRKVCYSGTPCQIEALKCFLIKDYENLLLVDVMCRAVPSPLVWEKYKKIKEKTYEEKIENTAFRSKKPYGYAYSQIVVGTENKQSHAGVETDPYLRAFFANLSDRPSCYSCVFKKRYRVSDITIWDCFNAYKFDKTFDDNQGTTRVLVHTKKGSQIIQQLEQCRVVQIDADKAVEGFKEMVSPTPMNPKRDDFFNDLQAMDDEQLFKKWFPDTAKVKLERGIRKMCFSLGIYQPMKRIARTFLGK